MVKKANNEFYIEISSIAQQSPGMSRVYEFDIPAVDFERDFHIENLQGVVAISVTEDGVVVSGDLTAETDLECSRCLEPFSRELAINFRELYVFSPSEDGDSKEELPFPADGYLNVKPLFREYALLDIPIKHVCREECKGLCPICGVNRNEEDCGHRQEKIDPRMAKLKQLLNEEDKMKMERGEEGS